MTDQQIANQTIEKHCIAGFLKDPKKLLELVHLIDEVDFVHKPHGSIFSILKDSALNNKATDPVIIAERLQSLGITFKGNLDIFNYLQSLSYIKISERALEDACRRLKTLTIRREIFEMATNMRDAMVRSGDIEANEIISMTDKMYADKIAAYDLDDKPEDLFENIIEMIEERGNNPLDETGLLTPYKKFNELYGGLRNGEIYAWVSRPKHGKQIAVNTPIYTINGWKNHGDLRSGDYVFHPSGKPIKVLAYIPQSQPCTLEVELSNGQRIKCHENHEWTVSKYNKSYTWEAKRFLNERLNVGIRGKRGCEFLFKLPRKKALSLPEKDLPIDPHWFGYWLGKGKTLGSRVTIINSDNYLPNTWPYKVSTINSNGQNNDSLHYNYGGGQDLYKKIKAMLGGGAKRIPLEYLISSKEQRLELLAGLIDSDGYLYKKSGQYRFRNANKQLVDDVCALISSLGWNYSLTSVAPCMTTSGIQGKLTNYQVGFVPSDIVPCRVKRKQSARIIRAKTVSVVSVTRLPEVEYEEGNCIMVDSKDGLYLVGEKMIPTHNSSILNDIAFKTSLINPNCRSLILDTEMQTVDMKYRIASAVTGIPMWWLETGNWKKNKELARKFESKKQELKVALGHVQHMTVAGRKVEEITSLIQRWYLGEVGRGNPAIVIYDYIKLTGEQDGNKQEYQLIGDKVDRLKQCFLRLNIPLLTACQLNRTAEGGNDDSSAIAQSDRLQWFASQVGIFRRKTMEEIADDGKEFGTHKYIELACRYQGKDAHGHSNLVKTEDAKGKVKYVNNYINYKVENFAVEELGSLEEIIKSKSVQVNVFEKENKEDNLF